MSAAETGDRRSVGAPSPADSQPYTRWSADALAGRALSRQTAAAILSDEQVDLLGLVHAAGQVRQRYFANTVSVHILDNVQNGACPEDCGYCGQSSDSTAPIRPYKLKTANEIVEAAQRARARGAWRFCMALSGRGPDADDIKHMCRAIERIKAMGLRTCLSAGLLDRAMADRLKRAGLDRLNHNLNTSRRHYPDVCTTHTYDDRLATLHAARTAGLSVCSGLIVGMGETHEDLLDVAYELRQLQAESIPVNFLVPIAGNQLTEAICDGQPLTPQFVLRVLCMMRLINPAAEIRIAAGRELHLRSMQALALWPANSLFVDGYLLTAGSAAATTLKMIFDAGFVPRLDDDSSLADVRQLAESAPPEPAAAAPADQSLPETAPLKLSVQAAPKASARSQETGV